MAPDFTGNSTDPFPRIKATENSQDNADEYGAAELQKMLKHAAEPQGHTVTGFVAIRVQRRGTVCFRTSGHSLAARLLGR